MPIAKIRTGKGARGLLAYLDKGTTGLEEKAEAWEVHDVLGTTPKEWALDMRRQAAMNHRIEKPYIHLSVSFDPNHGAQVAMSQEQRFAFASDVLARMGLAEHQHVMAIHRDTEHPHVHIVINRVGSNGTAYDMWKSKERTMEALRTVEQEYGFPPPKIEHHLGMTRGDIERFARGEALTFKTEFRMMIEDAVKRSGGTWEGFEQALADYGITPHINSNRTGLHFSWTRYQGDSAQTARLKSSQLGKAFRLPALEERIAQRGVQLEPIAGESYDHNGAIDLALAHATHLGMQRFNTRKHRQRTEPKLPFRGPGQGKYPGPDFEGIERAVQSVRAKLAESEWDYAARRWIAIYPENYKERSAYDAIQHARADVKSALHGRIAQLMGVQEPLALASNPTLTQAAASAHVPATLREGLFHLQHVRRLNDPRYWATVQAQADSALSRALRKVPQIGIVVAISAAAVDVVNRLDAWAESSRERRERKHEGHAHELELELVHRPNLDREYER